MQKDFIILSKWQIKLSLKKYKVMNITKSKPHFIFTTAGSEQTIRKVNSELKESSIKTLNEWQLKCHTK